MDLKELKKLFGNFDVEKSKVERFIDKKSLYLRNKNVFLLKETFKDKEVFGNSIVFIQLNKLLPTTFLLEFIKENSPNILKLKSKNQALNFTYGKSLSIDVLKSKSLLQKDKFYLIMFEDLILGYAKMSKDRNSKVLLENIMNVGEYLKEN